MSQKRNLSAFRQYQAHIASILEEENRISECSDGENEIENKSANDVTGNIFDASCKHLNASRKRTSQRSSYYTPPTKRIKRTPLSVVRRKPLQIEQSKRMSFHDLNLTTKNPNENSTTAESQELTIEWSSSDESDNVSQASITVDTQSTQKSIPASWECTQNSKNRLQEKNLFKRCRKGGYLHQLQQTIKNSKTERKFLEYDKKFNARQYVSLRVLKVESSFGVHLATVISPTNEISQIVLNADMAQHVTTDSILYSFVEQFEPYEIEHCDKVKRVTVQPHKVMIS